MRKRDTNYVRIRRERKKEMIVETERDDDDDERESEMRNHDECNLINAETADPASVQYDKPPSHACEVVPRPE